MEVINDQSCGWIDYKNRRSNIKEKSKFKYTIEEVFTVLSAARKFYIKRPRIVDHNYWQEQTQKAEYNFKRVLHLTKI